MYFFSKMQCTQMLVINQLCRYLFTSSIRNDHVAKQSRIISKLLRKDQPKRGGINYDTNITLNGLPKKQLSIHTQRRMNVLNKIFTEHITDMMSTGEIEPEILNRDVEISHVKITADFKFLNIYWIDNGTNMADTEDILRICALKLRKQLTQLYIMGYVPPIQFVKCRNVNITREVERRLAIADYGENHVPNVYPFTVNHVVTYKDSTHEHNESSENDDTFKINLPVMKHDVFNLDHARIISKIKVSLNNSRQTLQRRIENKQSDVAPPTKLENEQNIPNFTCKEEQQKLFAKFLAQMQKQRRLKYKQLHEDNISNDIDENLDDSEFDIKYDLNDFTYEDSEYKDTY